MLPHVWAANGGLSAYKCITQFARVGHFRKSSNHTGYRVARGIKVAYVTIYVNQCVPLSHVDQDEPGSLQRM